MAVARNRVFNESNKGIEAMRHFHIVGAPNGTYILPALQVDIDIVGLTVTAGAANVTAGTVDVYNAGITNRVAPQFTGATVNATAYSSLINTVNPGTYTRVKSGNPIVVVVAALIGGPISLRVDYEIPIGDFNAKVTTYGAYDAGSSD